MAISGEHPFPGVPPKQKQDQGPSQKDMEDANAGRLAPGGIERFIHKVAKSPATKVGLITGTIAAGGYEAYQNVPAIHQAVDSAYHNLLQTLGAETVVSTTFDNKKDKQTIGDSNMVRVTLEEVTKQGLLTPQFNSETGVTTIFSPLILPKGATATIDKTPYTVRSIEHQDERNIVPANTEIVFPKGARVTLIRGAASESKDPNLAYNVSFSWYDEKNNVTICWGFYPLNSGLKTSLPLYDQPIKGVSEINTEKLPISDGKTPIATTTIADTFYTAGAIYNGKTVSQENYRGQIKDLNYVTQNGKLLVLEPS